LDVVVQRSKRPINEVLVQLLDFELRGLVASVPGGYIKLGGK
jgi:DNA processing protein